MGGELEVLRVPRRVNAKSFARFRALPSAPRAHDVGAHRDCNRHAPHATEASDHSFHHADADVLNVFFEKNFPILRDAQP